MSLKAVGSINIKRSEWGCYTQKYSTTKCWTQKNKHSKWPRDYLSLKVRALRKNVVYDTNFQTYFYLTFMFEICYVFSKFEDTKRGNHKPKIAMSSNPANGKVYSIQHYVIKFVSDLRQFCGFLRVLWFPPPIKLTATI